MKMVILLCRKKSIVAKEIAEILTFHGANHITDSMILQKSGRFTVVTKTQGIDLKLNNAVVVFCDGSKQFRNLPLSKGIIGVCEETDRTALEILARSDAPVITCGMNQKNTVTLSSLNGDIWFTSLQRSLLDFKGNDVLPSEFKIKLKKRYKPFSVLAAATVLLLNGIKPCEF